MLASHINDFFLLYPIIIINYEYNNILKILEKLALCLS